MSKQEITEASPDVSVPLPGGNVAEPVLASPPVPPVQAQCYFNTVGSKIPGNVLVVLPWSGLNCARGATLHFPDIPGSIS